MSVEQLNADFAVPGRVQFIEGPGELPFIEVTAEQGRALISVYAGQVLSFQTPSSPQDLLFLSDKAYYQAGKAIKGGVPVCWPWFGADPEGLGRPAHGFVRNRMWSVLATSANDAGEAIVKLGMSDTSVTREFWLESFELVLDITVGAKLSLELVTRNTGDHPFTITQALHTYFSVGDIGKVQVRGLEDLDYIDKADSGKPKHQSGPVTIDGEVDRVYSGVSGNLSIDDAALERRIVIESGGSKSAVVWNPWAKIAAEMADLNDDDYKRMICVETTNAAPDVVSVAAGGEHRLRAVYSLESV